ncbi:MAG: type IV-A pilus assembly ATPase PilB [Comamonas sp.]
MSARPSRPPSAPAPLSELGRMLVFAGKLQQNQIEDITGRAQAAGHGFLQQLMKMQLLSAYEVAQTVSRACGAPLLDLEAVPLARLPANLLDPKLCQAYQILPLARRQNRLQVATADPTHKEAAQKIQFATQLNVDWIVVEHDKLARALQTRFAPSAETLDKLVQDDFEFDAASLESDTPTEHFSEPQFAAKADDTPVVKFLHKMLIDAINMRASDLHFEPYEHSLRVRFRIDGELREVMAAPVAIKDRLASRIKVLARMDIAEKRLPQDGRMKLRVTAERVIDFRVSSLPTLFGEKVVIRILDPNSARLGIDALGYEEQDKQRILEAIARPHGMVLVTGPTGSGKTVSLYTCLNLLNQPGTNICTVEDPSEINMPGVNQVNVNDKAGLDFASALRAFLRQDPDVIMVGEIRDLETADIALKAAQTGHLVLSTLHTNDAPSTVTRLLNMGIAPFHIAASVALITAQRLVRRLCAQCRQPNPTPEAALLAAGFKPAQLDGSWTPYRAVGCAACNNGYKGRVGIYQVMPISEDIQRIILHNGSTLDLAEQAEREGVASLRSAGLHKVRQGVTSLEEVLAVTTA